MKHILIFALLIASSQALIAGGDATPKAVETSANSTKNRIISGLKAVGCAGAGYLAAHKALAWGSKSMNILSNNRSLKSQGSRVPQISRDHMQVYLTGTIGLGYLAYRMLNNSWGYAKDALNLNKK